jgi:hypothetical protein
MKNDIEIPNAIKDTLLIIKRSFILTLLIKKNVFLTITDSDKKNRNKYTSFTISIITFLY